MLQLVEMLAFLPAIDGFNEPMDDDDLPQELVSCFETHYIGVKQVKGFEGSVLNPSFPWNVYQQTYDNTPRISYRHSPGNTELSYKYASQYLEISLNKGRNFSQKEKI